MKIDKKDKIFSLLVRERAGWICEAKVKCSGKHYPEGDRRGLECSHFWSRTARSTRWCGMNAAAHCTSCHFHLGGNPILFNSWIEGHLGTDTMERVERLARTVAHFSKGQLEDIYWHLKDQYKIMLAKRADGETGRIEFETAPEILDLETAARMQ